MPMLPSRPPRRPLTRRSPLIVVLTAALIGLGLPSTSMAQVYFNDAGASGPVEPTSFAPAAPCCLTDYVHDLVWQSWGGQTATASGVVVTPPNTITETTSPATVTLSGLGRCGGQPVYSSYEIQVAAGAAPGLDWNQARRGTFACRFSAANYRPSKRDADGGCAFLSLPPAWTPRLPKHWLYTGFCRMHWTGFATGPTAIGKGVLRTGLEQWGVEARLSGLAWCRQGIGGIGEAMAYTKLTMTTYGRGEAEDNGEHTREDNITVANANRLRANVGRHGLQRRTYRYTKSITNGCVAVAALARSVASPAHAASREVANLAAHDAASLAARIRHDARHRGPAGMTGVKVQHGCCGVRALEVYERARSGSFARYGAYLLELVTGRDGRIEKVQLSEFPTHRGYHFSGEVGSDTYNIDIGPSRGSWSISVGHAYHPDLIYTTGKVQLHEGVAQLTTAELQVLYEQAVAVLKKAEDHALVSEEAYLHPGLPCGLPEYQACEPGGKW